MSSFLNLPQHVIEKIIAFTKYKDFLNVGLTNKFLANMIANSPILIRKITLKCEEKNVNEVIMETLRDYRNFRFIGFEDCNEPIAFSSEYFSIFIKLSINWRF